MLSHDYQVVVQSWLPTQSPLTPFIVISSLLWVWKLGVPTYQLASMDVSLAARARTTLNVACTDSVAGSSPITAEPWWKSDFSLVSVMTSQQAEGRASYHFQVVVEVQALQAVPLTATSEAEGQDYEVPPYSLEKVGV